VPSADRTIASRRLAMAKHPSRANSRRGATQGADRDFRNQSQGSPTRFYKSHTTLKETATRATLPWPAESICVRSPASAGKSCSAGPSILKGNQLFEQGAQPDKHHPPKNCYSEPELDRCRSKNANTRAQIGGRQRRGFSHNDRRRERARLESYAGPAMPDPSGRCPTVRQN